MQGQPLRRPPGARKLSMLALLPLARILFILRKATCESASAMKNGFKITA